MVKTIRTYVDAKRYADAIQRAEGRDLTDKERYAIENSYMHPNISVDQWKELYERLGAD